MPLIRATAPSEGVPSGIVVAWPRADEPPDGWVLCDGTNGTDDLRGRTLRGTPPGGVVGSKGGCSSHKHTGGAHTHTFTGCPCEHSHTHALTTQDHTHNHSLCIPAHSHSHSLAVVTCTTCGLCGTAGCVVCCAYLTGSINNCGPITVTGNICNAGSLSVCGTIHTVSITPTGSVGSGGAVDTSEESSWVPYEDVNWIMKL